MCLEVMLSNMSNSKQVCYYCRQTILTYQNFDRCICCDNIFCVDCTKDFSTGWYTNKYTCGYCRISAFVTVKYKLTQKSKFYGSHSLEITKLSNFTQRTSERQLIEDILGNIDAEDCHITQMSYVSMYDWV
jgi:hypothetical protein